MFFEKHLPNWRGSTWTRWLENMLSEPFICDGGHTELLISQLYTPDSSGTGNSSNKYTYCFWKNTTLILQIKKLVEGMDDDSSAGAVVQSPGASPRGDGFVPSALGTWEHWDAVYKRELQTFQEYGDTGEIWWVRENSGIMIQKVM